MEVAEISQQRYSFGLSNYATVDILAMEILTEQNAKQFCLFIILQ